MLRYCLPLSVAASVCMIAPLSATGQQASIAWRSDLSAARQEAAQTGRNLLVHFWAPWCGPCQRLETNVFSQQAVAATLQQGLIPVKLNADDVPQIARAYGVDRLPTDLVLRPDGAVLAKFDSPQEPARYIAQVTPFCTANGQMGPATNQALASRSAAAVQRKPAQPAYADLQVPRNDAMAGYSDAASTNASAPNPSAPPSATGYGSPTSGGYAAHGGRQPSASQVAGGPPLPQRGGSPYGSYSPGPVSRGTPPTSGSRYMSYGTGQNPAAQAHSRSMPASGQPATQVMTSPSIAASRPAASGLAQQSPPAPSGPASAAAVPSNVTTGGTGPVAASNRPSLGIDGFCPVTLKHEQRWVPGDRRYGVIHRGSLYLFAGPQQQQQFWADPDAYSPVLSGIDPVLALDNGATVEGQREHGVEYDGHIYLFSSESTLQHFSRNPERYAGGVRQAMQGRPPTTLR